MSDIEYMNKSIEQNDYPLNQIYFYLTAGCNLRCRHCWIIPKYLSVGESCPALELELFRSCIQQAKPLGLSGVKLTGGEPLIHPQIHEILEVIRTEKLRLSVETNGVLCTSELAKEIADCEIPFVAVSLDGADAETHEWVRCVKGCFDDTLKGIENLVKAGFRPQLIMSLMKNNVDQIEALIRLAESLGAGSVKFNIIQPVARGKKMHDVYEVLTIQELVALGEWIENSLSLSTSLRLIYSHPAVFRPLSHVYGDNSAGCQACDILGILGVLANGSYALCGIGETVPELVFGHIARDRLEDVWKKSAILNELREGLPRKLHGICSKCLMKGLCLGFCIAMNYHESGELWAPFWYCEQARKAGLFPENRLTFLVQLF